MLSPELIEARKVVEDYKRLNQNTVKVVARTCPKMKCTYYETVKIDENAGQFAQLYKTKKKIKTQEKHLGRQLMNAPKPKKEKAKKQKPKKTVIKGVGNKRKERMLKCFTLHKEGYDTDSIAEIVGISYSIVRKDLTAYCKENNIKMLCDATMRVLNRILKGTFKEKIMEELNVTDKTVLFHFRKLKKVYPDLELTRDPINSYNTVRTDYIQRLLKEGRTIEEISDIMNIKEESVKCNIRRYESKMIVKSKAIKPSVDYSTVNYIAERLQNQIKTV